MFRHPGRVGERAYTPGETALSNPFVARPETAEIRHFCLDSRPEPRLGPTPFAGSFFLRARDPRRSHGINHNRINRPSALILLPRY